VNRANLLLAAIALGHCAVLAQQGGGAAVPSVARVVTDRSVFEIGPEAVARRFAPLASLRATVATREARRFTGENRDRGIAWVTVDFQATGKEPRPWAFLQSQICLLGTDLGAARSEFAKALGPAKIEEGRAVWSLGPHRELSVKSGKFDPPDGGPAVNGVLVELGVLQGEPE